MVAPDMRVHPHEKDDGDQRVSLLAGDVDNKVSVLHQASNSTLVEPAEKNDDSDQEGKKDQQWLPHQQGQGENHTESLQTAADENSKTTSPLEELSIALPLPMNENHTESLPPSADKNLTISLPFEEF